MPTYLICLLLTAPAVKQTDPPSPSQTARPWLGQVPPDVKTQRNPIEPTKQSVERGRRLYRAVCVGCHGSKALGHSSHSIFQALNPKPLLVDGATVLPDSVLAWVIANGVEGTPMKPMHHLLGPGDGWHIANYLANLAARQRTTMKK